MIMTGNNSLPINIIVAPSGWSEDKLNYRRHHLARCLLNEAGVERIFWLYPYAFGRQEYLKRLRQGSLELGEPEKGITEVGVPDFKGMSELFVGLQTNFLPGIAQVVGIKAHCRVWFTCPAFYGLFKLGCGSYI